MEVRLGDPTPRRGVGEKTKHRSFHTNPCEANSGLYPRRVPLGGHHGSGIRIQPIRYFLALSFGLHPAKSPFRRLPYGANCRGTHNA